MSEDTKQLQQVEAIVQQMHGRKGALLPILHAIKDALGCVPPAAVPIIAKGLNLSRAEVHGVISFYHDFKTEPGGENLVQLCRAEACQAMGARELETHVESSLGIGIGETTADGKISLEPVYCLGNCACSPSVAINQKVYARVDAARFDELIAELGRAAS
ncbi:MAG: formate dehydrogenase subunit gamma [Gammaproteobacteria bacterium]|nr:formate dehydrogenase subunit gamma [Gammaproteobacteria bacterium]